MREFVKKSKRLLTKDEKNVIKIMVAVTICALCVFAWCVYVNDYYHAEAVAKKAMMGNETVKVEEDDDYYVFSRVQEISYVGPGDGQGIIFYPGGKVEETAYAPLLISFAEQGYEVYLIKMPAKLAICGMNAPEDIM